MIRRSALRGALELGFGIAAVWAGIAAAQPSPPAETAAPAPADISTGRELTVFELLRRGGPVMYPLYLCSIVLVAFAVERAVNLRRRRVCPPALAQRIRDLVAGGPPAADLKSLLRDLDIFDSPLARILKAGLRKAGRPLPEIEKAIEDTGAKEAALLRRNCRALSVVGSLAPLLGLLGTVTGMIRAFMTVAARAEALGRTELLAAGIYEALVTTAVGLTIAIPAMVLYYLFVEKVDRLVADMDALAVDLVESMAAQGRAGEGISAG